MRNETEYSSKEATNGRLVGLLFMLLMCLFAAACSGQSVITEDFTDYKPAPQTISTESVVFSPPEQTSQQPMSNTGHQEIPHQNVNPIASEAKSELRRTGRTLLSLFTGIILTAIIVKTTTFSNAITTDYH
jgi:hypothetical protein